MPRIALVLAFSLACAGAAHAAEETRAVRPFGAVSVHGPFNVIVEAGRERSLTVRGKDGFVKDVASEVVNGELRVHMRDKNYRTLRGDQHIVITLPRLRAFEAEGAGEIRLNDMRGERLEVACRGAGQVRIAGAVGTLRVRAERAEEVDAKDLIAHHVDIAVQDVGEARVHASQRLDVQVRGAGKLTYFGRPRIVNDASTVAGAVRQGDR